MEVRIVLDKGSCVGNKSCLSSGSALLEMLGAKVHVKKSRQVGSQWVYEADLDEQELERIKRSAAICPTNAIHVLDKKTGEHLIQTTVSSQDACETIEASYDDTEEFVLDPKGYFLIRIVPESQEIEIAFCDKPNQIRVKIQGKKPIDIYSTFFNKSGKQWISRLDHAAYLGRELQKAYIALKLNLPYVQDDELDFSTLKTR